MGRVVIKSAGFRAYRKSAPMVARLRGLVEDIADDCNADADLDDGYIAKVSTGRERARGAVITGTAQAIRDNARNNTIIRNAVGKR